VLPSQADSFMKVKGIASNGSVQLESGAHFGLKNGSRYMMLNAKSLLDAPSEYWIDTKAHKLFFIPPEGADVSDPSGQGAFLSQAQTAHTMNGSSSIVLRGLRLEYAQGQALLAHNVSNVTIENCTISNAGTNGVELSGSGSTLSGCDIYDVGCSAVHVDGGDIPSLTSGNLTIHNNTLHRFARVSRTLRVGVKWSGCGNVISANEVFDAPQIGMIGGGVNMLFEDNDLHDLAKGSSDTGGFYAGRTWADRGNVVRRNKFRRFYQVEKMAQHTSVNGIYLDDMEAGWLVEDNYFESIHDCMFIGGGRQNVVRGNTFVNCTVPVHVDDRGMGWMGCEQSRFALRTLDYYIQ
jgi:parallel beta-helix repeat protein